MVSIKKFYETLWKTRKPILQIANKIGISERIPTLTQTRTSGVISGSKFTVNNNKILGYNTMAL
jgi:hypothetical protein